MLLIFIFKIHIIWRSFLVMQAIIIVEGICYAIIHIVSITIKCNFNYFIIIIIFMNCILLNNSLFIFKGTLNVLFRSRLTFYFFFCFHHHLEIIIFIIEKALIIEKIKLIFIKAFQHPAWKTSNKILCPFFFFHFLHPQHNLSKFFMLLLIPNITLLWIIKVIVVRINFDRRQCWISSSCCFLL